MFIASMIILLYIMQVSETLEDKVDDALKLFTDPRHTVKNYVRATFENDPMCADFTKVLTMFNCENLLMELIFAIVEELVLDQTYPGFRVSP